MAFGAGGVHRDVEAAETGNRGVDHRADVVLVTNISAHEFRFAACRDKLRHQGSASLGLAAGDDDLGALAGIGEGGGAGDAGEGTGDQNNWSIHRDFLSNGRSEHAYCVWLQSPAR